MITDAVRHAKINKRTGMPADALKTAQLLIHVAIPVSNDDVDDGDGRRGGRQRMAMMKGLISVL